MFYSHTCKKVKLNQHKEEGPISPNKRMKLLYKVTALYTIKKTARFVTILNRGLVSGKKFARELHCVKSNFSINICVFVQFSDSVILPVILNNQNLEHELNFFLILLNSCLTFKHKRSSYLRLCKQYNYI